MTNTLELDSFELDDARPTSETDGFLELDGTEISYSYFYKNHLRQNRPCLLKNVTREWLSQKSWIKDKKPNFSLLREKYGDAEVPVSNCNQRYFNAQKKCTMNMTDFLTYWQNYIDNGYSNDEGYYMKDWHFANENPSDEAYRVPPFFASDWINEYLLKGEKSSKDDYRFVYMGPKGTWTPLHCDVFSSFSWSVNICGKKKWLFFPPGSENCMKDKQGNLVYDVNDAELQNPNMYPNYSPDIVQIVLIQDVGDAVFVPSGWHHQVWNLDDTISFNHNWINACNVEKMYHTMDDCLASVAKEIADCREMDGWDEQCQLMLKSCFGMNYQDFFDFIAYITRRRLEHLEENRYLLVNGGWLLGPKHMKFDLLQIKSLLSQMIASSVPCYLTIRDKLLELAFEIDKIE